MTRTTDLLSQPVHLGARRLALDRLDQAEVLLDRLSDPADAEALHDLRVAVRRLRTVLRSYRPYFRKSVGGKLRKRLGTLMASTNRDRDAEVQRAWLAAQLRQRGPTLEHEGLELLSTALGEAAAESGAPTAGAFALVFSKLRERLLGEGRGEHRSGDAPPPTLAAVAADLIANERRDLETALASGLADGDDDAASKLHRARLRAKRLRYLLEPLQVELPAAEAAIDDLRGLQDLLGELNDLAVLAPRVEAELRGAVRRWRKKLVADAAAAAPTRVLLRAGPELRACRALAAVRRRVALERRRWRVRLERDWRDHVDERWATIDAATGALAAIAEAGSGYPPLTASPP